VGAGKEGKGRGLDNLACRLYFGVYCILFLFFFLYHLVMNKKSCSKRGESKCKEAKVK